MSHKPGEPIHGIVRNADVTTAVAIPIFTEGSNAARTLGANEYITVDQIVAVHAGGGDLHIFLGLDGTAGTGETVTRGVVSESGGIVADDLHKVGLLGETPWVASGTAGIVDVNFVGRIRQRDIGLRPSWREDQASS